MWKLQSNHIAQALVRNILTLSLQKIILGGRVMKQRWLFPLIRQEAKCLLNGYLQLPKIIIEMDLYIVSPALGHNAGLTVALILWQQEWESRICIS